MFSGMNQSIPGVCTEGRAPDACGGRVPEPAQKNSVTLHFMSSRAPATMHWALGTGEGLGHTFAVTVLE